jgi:ankyrin repeat protein
MPTDTPRPLPSRPNLRHLKDQAKDLLRSGAAASLSEAQFQIATSYGFPSWPKLKAHVESLHEAGQLKLAIDANDLEQVKALMTRNPALHQAPLGYRNNGPLTWVAECRIPWEPPSRARLAIAEWMLTHGSDIHQGGDGPLMRAALAGMRIPMMELLVRHGADVNALWNGNFPIILAPCETVDPAALKWLLEYGADPRCPQPRAKNLGTALDYVIRTYARSPHLGECIDLLRAAGCPSRYDPLPVVIDLLCGRADLLAEHLAREPQLVSRRFAELDFGVTAARRLTLTGATLLHVAAEYGQVEAAKLLLEGGADVNSRTEVNQDGVGGQTPIFHCVTQFYDWGVPMTELLLQRGADLSVRARLPGHYERPEEFVECTPLEYAELFPGPDHHGAENKAIRMLRERGAR